MEQFSFQETIIPELTLAKPFFSIDNRGWFSKPFETDVFAAHGIELFPREELRSCSKKGVLREIGRASCRERVLLLV